MFRKIRRAGVRACASVLLVLVSGRGVVNARTLRAEHRSPGPPNVKVLDWDGHRGALTLTFDDGSPSAVDEAVPVLDEKGVKGTFFITKDNAEGREEAWSRAAREGHELGNHTVHHCHGADLGAGNCLTPAEEIDQCNDYIVSRLGAPAVYTFAYPFVDTSLNYEDAVASRFLLARAGNGGSIDAASEPDWYTMDSKFIEPSRGETVKDWKRWVDGAAAHSKWLVLVFHSILPEKWFEPVSEGDLAKIVDHAKALDDVWIDTFVNVGAYLRAQQLFESVRPAQRGTEVVWQWELPEHFPPGRWLRVEAEGGALVQAGAPLPRDSSGAFRVALDAGSLTWRPSRHSALTASAVDHRPRPQ